MNLPGYMYELTAGAFLRESAAWRLGGEPVRDAEYPDRFA